MYASSAHEVLLVLAEIFIDYLYIAPNLWIETWMDGVILLSSLVCIKYICSFTNLACRFLPFIFLQFLYCSYLCFLQSTLALDLFPPTPSVFPATYLYLLPCFLTYSSISHAQPTSKLPGCWQATDTNAPLDSSRYTLPLRGLLSWALIWVSYTQALVTVPLHTLPL